MSYKSGKLKDSILLQKLLHQEWVAETWWHLTRLQEGTKFPLFLLDTENESVYNIGIVNKREIIMNQLTKLQKEYTFFKDMLNSLERKKKKTPGNGFAIMKCKEKIAEIDKIFNDIDYAVQITFD